MTTTRRALWLHGAGAGARDAPFEAVVACLGDGVEIIAPQLGEPDATAWGAAVGKLLDQLPEDTLLIGHSLGASTLLKTVAEGRPRRRAPALFGLAPPFWGANGWDHASFALPANSTDALTGIGAIHLYHSSRDEIVDMSHSDLYAAALPRAVCRIVPGADHMFSGSSLGIVAADLANCLA